MVAEVCDRGVQVSRRMPVANGSAVDAHHNLLGQQSQLQAEELPLHLPRNAVSPRLRAFAPGEPAPPTRYCRAAASKNFHASFQEFARSWFPWAERLRTFTGAMSEK